MEVTVEHLGAVQFEIKARQHTISCDQPTENCGGGEGSASVPDSQHAAASAADEDRGKTGGGSSIPQGLKPARFLDFDGTAEAVCPPGSMESIQAFRVCVIAFLSPLRGLLISHLPPTACAVGCILSPLRGWYCVSCLPLFQTRWSHDTDSYGTRLMLGLQLTCQWNWRAILGGHLRRLDIRRPIGAPAVCRVRSFSGRRYLLAVKVRASISSSTSSSVPAISVMETA